MGAFDKEDDVTNVEEKEEIDSYLERIAQERGEKWKDPEVLAKGKWEADKYIKDLERQLEEARKDIEREEKLDRLMEMIKSGQDKDPNGSGGHKQTTSEIDPSHTDSGQLSDEQIRALVEKHVSQREQESTRQKNLSEVESRLDEEYGATANQTLRVRAKELGMSVQELEDTAARNPRAFYRLIGLDQPKTKEAGAFVGNARRGEAAPSRPTGRDWAYYQDLRRKSKAQYFSPTVQQQLIRDREAMGEEAFYGRSRS